MKRIVILMHESQTPGRHHYLIDALGEVWRRQGLHVSCVYGVREHPEADLLIPHVNLTRLPARYVEYIASFPHVANRDVADISKRTVSAELLRPGDDYEGPVLVKTDRNYGGRPEYRAFRRRHPVLARLGRHARAIADRFPGQRMAWRRVMDSYVVYDSLAAVPRGAFRNPALVVERFLPEREGDRFFIRHYLCLGDRRRSVRVAGSAPFLKRKASSLVDEGLPVPEAVLGLRRRLGLDYGKIDYTMHQGRPAILDVNRTPGVPGAADATARTVGDLADGIWSLLRER